MMTTSLSINSTAIFPTRRKNCLLKIKELSPTYNENKLAMMKLILISLFLIQAFSLQAMKANSLQQTTNQSNQTNSTTTTTTTDFLYNLVKSNFNPNNSQSNQAQFSSNNAPANQRFLTPLMLLKQRPGQQREHMHYKTTYACEGNQLDLSCQEGKLIHLVRANYGRFSVSICNDLGHSNLSVQCASFRAFLIMETRCNKLSNCSVIVSKELFGDPCEGTSKYLEVQYYCDETVNNQQQSTQNSLANQQQQQQQQASIGTRPIVVGQDSPETIAAAPPQSGHKSLPGVGGAANSAPADNSGQVNGGGAGQETSLSANTFDNGELVNGEQSSQRLHSSVITASYCAPQTSSRNLYWNYTRAGHFARQACPEGSSGRVSWLCDGERPTARFSPAWSPDFSKCKSTWLQRLAVQLDQMLEAPSIKQSSTSFADSLRQQNEQLLKIVLNDLTLMARTKELFSEDLKRIDIMISQIISQLKSLSAQSNFYQPSSAAAAALQMSPTWSKPNQMSLYEELFTKLSAIVSSLFDASQRNAWLEIQPNEVRKRLEQRFLNHLKDSGLLFALHLPLEQQRNNEPITIRQANLIASITVINNNVAQPIQSLDNVMETAPTNLNRFSTFQSSESGSAFDQLSEFKVHSLVARELIGSGITRFLALDVKKPDYSLIRQQLESTYNTLDEQQQQQGQQNGQSNTNNNLLADNQQWSSRAFGLFGIVGENGDILEANANQAREQKLSELLAQWPISIDFKVAPQAPAGQQLRQCNFLGDNNNNNNRCHTFKSNATNHICRCEQFGFVSLTSAFNQVPPTNMLSDFQWPQLISSNDNNNSPYNELNNEQSSTATSTRFGAFDLSSQQAGTFIGAASSQNKQQTSLGIWATVFIIIGLSLLVISLVGFVVNIVLKTQSRLNKKQGFLSTGVSILTGNNNRESAPGPTLTDPHIMSADHQLSMANNATSIGLNQSSCHGYKTHQQLYAAHLPPIDSSYLTNHKWPSASNSNKWISWIKPSRLFPSFLLRGTSGKNDNMIQHRIIGSSLNGSSGSNVTTYKSQHQNGYTTSLHHHHHHNHHQSPRLPLNAAPSSSTSSYVSSSVYYEEIGPGNLTKVNTNQLTNSSRTLTIVDPFKRQIQAAPDQQQLIHSHQNNWQPQPNNTSTLSYALNENNNNNQQQTNYGQQQAQQMSMLHNTVKQQSDLSNQFPQQISSSSSAVSTPRHYLFASPTAVNAYKSSLGQPPVHYHHQQPLQQQQLKGSQEQHRFMQN